MTQQRLGKAGQSPLPFTELAYAVFILEIKPMNQIVDVTKEIQTLVEKAAKAEKSEDAMRFTQAACNAANAMACIRNISEKPTGGN